MDSKIFEDFIRSHFPAPGPGNEGVQLEIKYVYGFELFNTRPYHNYETWSSGWFITCNNPFEKDCLWKEGKEPGRYSKIHSSQEYLTEAMLGLVLEFLTWKKVAKENLWDKVKFDYSIWWSEVREQVFRDLKMSSWFK